MVNYLNFNIPKVYKKYSNEPELIINSSYKEPKFNGIKFDFVIGRAGWGIVWECLIKCIPLLIIPPNEFDDPEIFLNYETLMHLKLVLPISVLQSNLLNNQLDNLRLNIKKYNQSLIKTFGTLSGSEFISNHGMIDKFIL